MTTWNRRGFLGASGAGLLGGILGEGRSVAQEPARGRPDVKPGKRPNIIFFMPDEMRADALACYGNPVVKTPNIDALARSGTRFENCHVQFPVCTPSRCSMATGLPTCAQGHRSLYYLLRSHEPNMFRDLKRAGYDTFMYGGHNDLLATECFHDSMTEWEGGPPINGDPNRPAFGETPGIYSMLFPPAGDRRKTGDYEIIQNAIRVLERKEQDKPFCLYLPMTEPHPLYTIPADFYDMYKPSEVPAPVPGGLPKKPSFHREMRAMYGTGKLTEATFRKIRAVYYAKVSYSDWLLGELMAALHRTGHDKDTVVYLLADHGDYTGDYGLVEKWTSGLEDCMTHVPLMVHVPGAPQGQVSKEMVELFDVMPTALELAGTRAEHTHFARSLMPQIHGAPGDPNRDVFSEGGYNVYEPQCFEPLGAGGGPYQAKIRLQNEKPITISRASMIRTRTHKLILRPQDQSEFYALESDPHEERNLYGEASVARLESQLKDKLLDRYINVTGVPPMSKDPRETPPFYPTRKDLTPVGWQKEILDA